MDNRAGGQGPYDRPYFGDPNALRQQMAAYGMHQNPFSLSQQHLQADGFQRRQSHDMHSMSHAAGRVNNLTSPQASNPWLHPFQTQQVNNDYSMNMANMYHSRWEQEQQSPLLQQHSSAFALSSKLQENHLQRDREIQLQRERDEQAQLLYRERHLQQLQQEREAQLQREREIQIQKEKEREILLQREKEMQLQREHELQMQRERELQMQREREAQLQREREAQMQREREAQLQRERQLQMQREQELQLQRERENQAMREREAQFDREKKSSMYNTFYSQQQQAQQYPSYYTPTPTSLSTLNYTQSNNLQQQQQQFYNHQNISSNLSMNRQNMQSSPMLGNFSVQQMFHQSKAAPEYPTLPPVSKSTFATSSLLHFPQSSPVATSAGFPWSNSTNLLRKSSSSSFDNGIINSIVSDKSFLTSPLDSNSALMKNWTDIADMDLSEIEKNVLGPKEKDEKISDISPTLHQIEDSGQVAKNNNSLSDSNFNGDSLLSDNAIDFTRFPIASTKESSSTLSEQLYNTPLTGNSSNNSVTISSSSVQVSQSNSVNINISISVPSNTSSITEISEAVISKAKSTIASVLPSFADSSVLSTKHDNASSVSTVTTNYIASHHNVSKMSDGSPIATTHQKQKSKNYSSIESFLGMSGGNDNDSKDKENDNTTSTLTSPTTEVPLLRTQPPDKQDRISVIKSVPTLPKEINGHITSEDEKLTQASQNAPRIMSDKENEIQTQEKVEKPEPKSGRLLHPSMRMKKQKTASVTTTPVTTTTKAETTVVSGRPLHPSMRLTSNAAKPIVSRSDNLDDSFERKANILHSPKAVNYQSEKKADPVDQLKSPPPTLKSPTSGKPMTLLKPVHGGKPASYSVSGGKPASYSFQVSGKKDSPTVPGGKPTTGKPLSYLKSVMESSKPSTEEIKEIKSAGKKRTRKETAESTVVKKANQSSPVTSTKKANEPPPKLISPPSKPATLTNKRKQKSPNAQTQPKGKATPKNKQQATTPKATESLKKQQPPKPSPPKKEPPPTKSNSLKAKQKPEEDLISPREKPKSEEEIPKRETFKFKEITIETKKDEESSDSDSGSSSDSDSDESNDSSSDGDDESGSGEDEEEEDTCSQTSSPSPTKKTPRSGQKRKAVPDNAEVIANLKKRKIVEEDVIKIPLQSGWRRQTRLRPTNSGDGLRGDVYYYSPCGKKLRTYPELNTYICRNDIKDVELKHFSFSTKLRVGEFLEAKQGSKFEKLTDEQVTERFEMMEKKSRASKEKAEERNKKKQEKEEKQRKALEEKQQKKMELQEKRRQKEEDRRKALREKAMEVKMKKEKEKEAAKEVKRLKEEAIMLKKLEKKAQLEANRIAKREKVQNMLAEKQRIKEQKEQERLMKIEQQKMKQLAIENEKERKRQQQVISKVHEKEKRKRELVMMKAYEAQRRAEERERLKEQKKLEKTLMRQRKLEQKRYERLISKELKKPIDDMALTDLKPLPTLPQIVNMNIPGKAYADLLMVEEFVHAFGHVLDIDPEKEFPSMGELQSSLLCESGSEDAIFTACQALLFYALYDPGVSGCHSKTALGVDIANVELNESNISEVLRLFILSRNEGKEHPLSDALAVYPLEALSAVNKAAVLAFITNELLCGKSIGREIDGSLENISNMRRDKWNLEGEMRKLRADLSNKKPKQPNETPEKKNKENTKESDDEKDSDIDESTNQDVTAGPNDTLDDTMDADNSELENPTTVEQMEKKLRLMEKRHARFRKKLFDSSHTIRGINLGQDRYKRRYFVLPNAGGIYVEGLESGFFDEEMNDKTKEQKEERKEHLDNLLTCLKSPNSLKKEAPTFTSPTENKPSSSQTEKALGSPPVHPRVELLQANAQAKGAKNEPPERKPAICWFSLQPKRHCDSSKFFNVPPTPPVYEKRPVQIITPSLKQLGDDRRFLESIYSCYSSSSNVSGAGLFKDRPFPMSKENMSRNALLGLPPELDLNLLIQQDPQKAAEILEIQTAVPQEIPEEMRNGWWRITEPEQMHRLNKCAHVRGMRERNLQKTVARFQEYTNTSCKKNNTAFSLLLPDEENESKEPKEEGVVQKCENEWFPQIAYASDKAMLIEVEELEEKVFSASLQVKGTRLSQKISPNLQLNMINENKEYNPPENEHPIKLAALRLLSLESAIERRYLKPPFRTESLPKPDTDSKDDCLKNSNVQATITPALQKWRNAVNAAKSAAQLSMCVNVLFESVAWEKSIMKVFCILCRKSDNEELLLLCDACDRGCHTYCCKPKLDTIPEGDWFCQECVLMASGSDQCYKCKGKSGKRLKCGFCPRHYHMQCLEPPLHKTPRQPWACPVCKKTRSKSKPPPKKKPRAEELLKREEQNKTKQSNSRMQTSKDMEPCRVILSEMENHESAWPFLVPVNMKQFPEYYQVIKHPMDFHTMKTKLRDYQYKNKEEFARDARLVFSNCKTYNEDESDVGRAGETMGAFFEKRWPVIKKNLSTAVQCSPSSNNKSSRHDISKREESDMSDDDENEEEGDVEESSSSSEEISSESESSEVEEDSEPEGTKS